METSVDRFNRFTQAKEKCSLWHSQLQEVYRYIFPYKNHFFRTKDKKESQPQIHKSKDIFDMTAVVAAQSFANNFQTIMLPPYREWAMLSSGSFLEEEVKANQINDESVKEKFQNITETLFYYINSSNFNLAIHEALLDFCIGTGVILINEINDGDSDNSAVFDIHSIPLHEVYFEEGQFDSLENFWREQSLTVRQILRNWPQASLTEAMHQVESSSGSDHQKKDKEFSLIEGVIYYPEREKGKGGEQTEQKGKRAGKKAGGNGDDSFSDSSSDSYYYYIQDESTKKEIFSEWRDYCPFIGFRYSRSSGDLIGHGLGEFALSFIRVVNKIAELDLKALQFKTQPPYLYDPRKVKINPNSLMIEPGSFVPVSFDGGVPVQSFPLPNESRFSQLSIVDLQKTIREIFLSGGLEEALTSPKMTATEVAFRQQEFIRKISGAIGRFAQEFIRPFLTSCLKILRKKGKLKDLSLIGHEIGVKMNDQLVKIEYQSPLLTLQHQQDIDSLINWITLNIQLFQGNASQAMNLEMIPSWLA